jgi:GNAT superfamily N-acetyltransferase
MQMQFDGLKVRPYEASDREACLALLEANTPKFFAKNEAETFSAYLDKEGVNHYWVIVHPKEKIVASGGLTIGTEASLNWGMVRPDLHLKGIGSLLVAFRLLQAVENPAVARVAINTSQRNPLFYARFGFSTENIQENHFARGLHRYDMRLVLTEKERPILTQKLTRVLDNFKLSLPATSPKRR